MNVLRKPFTIVSLSSSTNWTLHGLRSSTVIGFAQRTLPLIDISLSRFTIVIPLLYLHVGGEEEKKRVRCQSSLSERNQSSADVRDSEIDELIS